MTEKIEYLEDGMSQITFQQGDKEIVLRVVDGPLTEELLSTARMLTLDDFAHGLGSPKQ